jgi:hypothetical protein
MAITNDSAGGFARERSDFAFQLANARFARVIMDERAQSSVGEFHFLFRQAMLFQLAGNKIPFGNLKLFGFGIAGQFDHFEAITQGRVNRFQPVRRCDEQYAREIKWNIEIMIGERVVLRRIQNFEQCRGRIAPKISANFIEFVEQDDGITTFDTPKRLDDPTGQGANVSAAMTANFRFVAHATKSDASEFAAESIGDAAAQRSLTDAGRADKAEDGTFDLFAALDDGEEFDQTIFDFGQAEMLFVENALGFGEIDFILSFFHPGQRENPVDIMPRNAVFRGRRGHLLQTLQFLSGDLFRLIWQRCLLDLLAKRPDFTGIGIRLAKFALNGAHLFAQEKVALRFGNRSGDFGLNF